MPEDLRTAPLEDAALIETRSKRPEFLLAMYKATWDNINRHILVVWQSVTALLAAVGALYLSGKDVIAPDVAAAIVVLAATWAVAHAIDAKGWYNRNLHIIANIERQFLLPSDAQQIHPFFALGARGNTMIEHLRIQAALGYAIALLALTEHFGRYVWPTLNTRSSMDLSRWLPYLALLVGSIFLVWISKTVGKGHNRLVEQSPGAGESVSD
jgi:hypothetical protein